MSDAEEPTSVADLEEEGDVAADYLEGLLDACDLDGDLDLDVRNGRPYLGVVAPEGADLERLARPEVVTALQNLVRLAVQTRTGRFSRLVLDVGGSRESRRLELVSLVEHAAERLAAGASEAALPPMTAYERKIVHDVVAEQGLWSESRGDGAGRYTVISKPAGT